MHARKSIWILTLCAAMFSSGATEAAQETSTPAGAEKEAPSSPPPNVIFDTDIWGDIDDAMALAMLHALQDRHEARLIAVTISTADKSCPSYVDLVDTFYGHPEIPIGIVHGGVDLAKTEFAGWVSYTKLLSERRRQDHTHVYLRYLADGTKIDDATFLLRKTLARQPDQSVVMIQVGYSTNNARLMESGPDVNSPFNGRDLIRKKVRLLVAMAGVFANTEFMGTAMPMGSTEFNLSHDTLSAQKVFSEWPTPIVASGSEIGQSMPFPAYSIDHDFAYVNDHPIADAYRTYFASFGKGKDYYASIKWHTADLTAVLYAVRPDSGYFSLSKPGMITVLDDGGSRFDESEDGTHRHLILSEDQRARALEAMVMLVSQPPAKKLSIVSRLKGPRDNP
jgi:purine nucleosidase